MSPLLSLNKQNLLSDNWQNLSVQDFFSAANWPGLENYQLSNQPNKNLELFSVEEFFTSCNWSGKIDLNREKTQLKTLSLTLSVREFFLNIKWDQPTQMATKIQEKPEILEANIPQEDQFSLNDLSDLF